MFMWNIINYIIKIAKVILHSLTIKSSKVIISKKQVNKVIIINKKQHKK